MARGDPSAPSWCTAPAFSGAAATGASSGAAWCSKARWTLENAGRWPGRVYRECTLYTTLSPCAMCSSAILLYGIPRVVGGENRTFLGEEDLLRARGVSVEAVQGAGCRELMAQSIRAQPTLWAEDIGDGDDRIDR